MQTGIVVKQQDGKEEIIHIPYNLDNRFITEDEVIKLLQKYNVNINKVNRIETIREAFVHKSYCKKQIFTPEILSACRIELGNPKDLLELQENSYERLEFFGDKVLKLFVCFYIFNRYPTQDEGFMTRLQTKIEDKKNLSIMSKEMGLGKYFIISRQIENMNGRNIDKINEDIFEAFLGGLCLSNGLEICMDLITNLLETQIDYSEKLYCDNNYKIN
jgi:dsRNA-specific ribonuclease